MGIEKIETEIITCDKCGKKVENLYDLLYMTYRNYFNNTASAENIEFAICEDCAKEFNKFVKNEEFMVRNVIALPGCKFKHPILK